jgi:hypothetical protein
MLRHSAKDSAQQGLKNRPRIVTGYWFVRAHPAAGESIFGFECLFQAPL